jgi:nucleotide-binding universal stress UspA family protein
MHLHHIVVATDESDAGRQAVRAGLDLATRASARLTVMRAVPIQAMPALVAVAGDTGPANPDADGTPLDRLQQWLRADVVPAGDSPPIELGLTVGIPGIEICRFAEREGADLLVLGRKQRSQVARLLLGDTADAVARRSRIPCLFVAPGAGPIGELLVALDGTERGMTVLTAACGFARRIDARLRVITVDYGPNGEPPELGSTLPVARSNRLRNQVSAIVGREMRTTTAANTTVEIRRGAIVQQILAEVEGSAPGALVFGYHRGGPPGIIEAGSVARHLAHTAPCAVLTVPL